MHNARYKTRYFPFSIFIVVGVLVWVLMAHYAIAWTAATYTDSAHGNASYGVNRSGTGYPIGSCAHCHDTFDSGICGNDVFGFMLFASNDNPASQTGNFCFECHEGFGSVQVRDGGLKNHTYSTNFGGGTATFTTIYDAFNPPTGATPSSHNLSDVLNHAVGRDIGFTSDTNACFVCHDQHLAQQNYPVISSGLGGVKTAIRRPLDYASTPTELWGDDAGELMIYYWNNNPGRYQQPYYEDQSGTKFEPSGASVPNDGADVPDYLSFCLDCHADPVESSDHGTLVAIDWSKATGNWHGSSPKALTGMGYPIAPYTVTTRNYLLSCTDCHEPHGSENEWLLRTTVNGKDGISVNFEGDWWEFCTACHVLTNPTANSMYHRQRPEGYFPGCPECHIHDESDPNNNF